MWLVEACVFLQRYIFAKNLIFQCVFITLKNCKTHKTVNFHENCLSHLVVMEGMEELN